MWWRTRNCEGARFRPLVRSPRLAQRAAIWWIYGADESSSQPLGGPRLWRLWARAMRKSPRRIHQNTPLRRAAASVERQGNRLPTFDLRKREVDLNNCRSVLPRRIEGQHGHPMPLRPAPHVNHRHRGVVPELVKASGRGLLPNVSKMRRSVARYASGLSISRPPTLKAGTSPPLSSRQKARRNPSGASMAVSSRLLRRSDRGVVETIQ